MPVACSTSERGRKRLLLDKVIWDEGVSGISTKLAERQQGRRLFDLLRSW
jgi:hypothetical protein